MKLIKRVFSIGLITLALASCSSQKDSPNNGNEPNEQRRGQQQGGRQGRPPNFAQLMADLDSNKDGKLSKSEAKGPLQNDFEKIDKNGDGFVSEEEFKQAPRPQGGQRPARN